MLIYNSIDLLLRSGYDDSYAAILALGKAVVVAIGLILSTFAMGRLLKVGRRSQLMSSVVTTVACMAVYGGAFYATVI